MELGSEWMEQWRRYVAKPGQEETGVCVSELWVALYLKTEVLL